MAECIRAKFGPEDRDAAIGQIVRLTKDPHDNPIVRIKAFETLAKHGWPEEARGTLMVETPDGKPLEIHHHFASPAPK